MLKSGSDVTRFSERKWAEPRVLLKICVTAIKCLGGLVVMTLTQTAKDRCLIPHGSTEFFWIANITYSTYYYIWSPVWARTHNTHVISTRVLFPVETQNFFKSCHLFDPLLHLRKQTYLDLNRIFNIYILLMIYFYSIQYNARY